MYVYGFMSPKLRLYLPKVLKVLKRFTSTMNQNLRTGVSLRTVIEKLSEFAPASLAESWDNVGLLVEPANEYLISRILLTNDLTEDVTEEAVNKSANMIISYHPPIFAPMKRITSATWKERIIARCLANNIAVYSPHTSWDVVQNGLNDWLASAFEYKIIEPVIRGKVKSPKAYILNIDCESADYFDFLAHFKCLPPLQKSEYEILEVKTSSVEQNGCRLVIRCSNYAMKSLSSVLEGNPHVPLYYFNSSPRIENSNVCTGIGRKGTLQTPISIREAVEKLKAHLNLNYVQLAIRRDATLDDPIETIAFVAGSGSSVLKNISCDLKITGEASHHDVLDWIHTGSSVILTNHSNSERGFLSCFADILSSKLDSSIEIMISTKDSDPLKVM